MLAQFKRHLRSARQYVRRLRGRLSPTQRVLARLNREFGGVVVARGPFRGLDYGDVAAHGSALFPKLVGSYEQELHPVIEAIVDLAPEQIIDVGAAEGFYAVGLATRLQGAEVLAFETEGDARQSLKQLAERNGVADRVRLEGHCGPTELAESLSPGAVLVCDCEGGEYELLDPGKLPQLTGAAILAEVHTRNEHEGPQVFQDRFGDTHEVEVLTLAQRDPESIAKRFWLTDAEASQVMDEYRVYGNAWVWMRPKDAAAAA